MEKVLSLHYSVQASLSSYFVFIHFILFFTLLRCENSSLYVGNMVQFFFPTLFLFYMLFISSPFNKSCNNILDVTINIIIIISFFFFFLLPVIFRHSNSWKQQQQRRRIIFILCFVKSENEHKKRNNSTKEKKRMIYFLNLTVNLTLFISFHSSSDFSSLNKNKNWYLFFLLFFVSFVAFKSTCFITFFACKKKKTPYNPTPPGMRDRERERNENWKILDERKRSRNDGNISRSVFLFL